MEAEPLDLEDGEIVDDEQTDVFGTYKILERPHVAPVTDTCTNMRYNDESDNSADSESDSDSDSTHTNVKRPKLKLKKHSLSKDWPNKNDKYKVWCKQMQEESLTEDLISCGVTKKLYQERSVESYNFTLRYNDREPCNNNSSDDEKDVEQRLTNKRTNSDRHNVKLRLGKRKNSSMDLDNQKGSVRIVADLSTTVDSTDADIAIDITTKLSERKDLLIRRVVDIIGKEKAIDFFQKTKKIEESGGMLIMNGSRRRTAGGVYFWLVKNDKHIPQEKIREIFYYDQKESSEQRKKANDARQKTQELMKSFENKSEKDLPTLLTRAELSTRQIAEQARLRRGEGMDRMPLDSDRTVSNPPPSPVTDDPDHSEQSLTQRHVQDYADDFLDIGADVDYMEVL